MLDQKQIMERNLAELFNNHQTNYETSNTNNSQLQPTNPFQKRIFEKRMRRSSVQSQNLNHIQKLLQNSNNNNSNLKKNKYNEMNYQFQQVQNIISNTKKQLSLIQQKVKQDLMILFQSQQNEVMAYQKAQKIVQGLKFNMEGIIDYVKNNSNVSFNQMSKLYDSIPSGRQEQQNDPFSHNRQQNFISVPEKNQKKYNYFQNCVKSFHQDFPQEEQFKSAELFKMRKRCNSSKGSLLINNEMPKINQNNHDKSKKSIYEMVLQERKNKMDKKKKMI